MLLSTLNSIRIINCSHQTSLPFMMAARTHAEARGSQLFTLLLFLFVSSPALQEFIALIQYGKAELWKLGKNSGLYELPKLDFIPPELQWTTRTPTTPLLWPKRQRRHHKQNRGSLRTRLHARPHRPALPSLLLTNARSLTNKIDVIWLRIVSRRMDSCVAIFTKTWLDNNIPNAAVELAGHSVSGRLDRSFRQDQRRRFGSVHSLVVYSCEHNQNFLLPWFGISGS